MANKGNTSFLGVLSMPENKAGAKTMIDVDHVSMIFNIASEQLNSLKEYAIALSRRELRFKEFYALDDISFQVKQGDVFGILGTNGSGKSTLLKIIAGVLEPSKGSCHVEGSIAPLIELGAGFDLELTARENIFLNGALLGYSKKFIQHHFDEIVDFAEVRDFLDMPMKNYSSGMVARIAFAIATVIIPDVLIVDEVLSVGDFMFQQKCERRIKSLIKEHGVTVLIVSHNNDQIERLCNKAVWIEKGHLRAIGSAREICELYRAVGGRPGSSESEKTILDLLNSEDTPDSLMPECVFGDDHFGTAIKFNEFSSAPNDIIILTNCQAGRENRIATSLAGVLNGAILTAEPDRLPDITLQDIKHKRPRRIVIVGSGNQISNRTIETLRQHNPDTIVDRVDQASSPVGIESWKYALSHGKSWGSTAVLVCQDNEAAIVSLAPYAFASKAPFFYYAEDSQDLPAALNSFERILVVGKTPTNIREAVEGTTAIVEFAEQEPQAVNDQVIAWLTAEHASKGSMPPTTMVITSPDSYLDNLLIGPFAGRLDALLVFQDPQNLDSMAHAFESARRYASSINRIVFAGSELRFSALNKRLMIRAISH